MTSLTARILQDLIMNHMSGVSAVKYTSGMLRNMGVLLSSKARYAQTPSLYIEDFSIIKADPINFD